MIQLHREGEPKHLNKVTGRKLIKVMGRGFPILGKTIETGLKHCAGQGYSDISS